MKIGYKISDNFIVISCSKNASTTVMLQSLCYNEQKKIDEYNDLEFKHVNQSIYSQLWPYTNKYKIICDNIKKYTNLKLIFIFRDPIKRFLSAYKTWFVGGSKTFDEFVKFVKEDIETYKDNINIINQHYRPQYTFINFDDIDIFIEQKDYEMFCNEQGIQYLKANQNKDLSYQSKIELTDEHISILKDLYKEDYEMIEKIKNSGKLYNGTL